MGSIPDFLNSNPNDFLFKCESFVARHVSYNYRTRVKQS